MIQIAGFFTLINGYFPYIVIACAELIAAIILIGVICDNKRKASDKGGRFSRITEPRDVKGIFLHELEERKGEVCLVIRVEDRMPVYEAGDIDDMLGISYDSLKKDIVSLRGCMADPHEGTLIWDDYVAWDGNGTPQYEFRIKSGEWVKLSVNRNSDGRYDMMYFWRTTEFHKVMDEFETKLYKAEEASRSKTTFLSRMSHEIRTPMNGIMGMLTLAKNKLEPEDPVVQYIDKAGELSEHMLSLINDILDMSRIEAGKVELEKKPLSIKKLGDKLYNMFAKNLEARGIDYSINYEKMTVDNVIGDELRLSQIIINFLSNAVKFTEQGEISVTFRQMMLKDNMVDLLIRVHDTGIGMDAEFIKRIFRPFEQASIETSKKYGGTGLGMAITDNLVKLMGGEIVVESLKGEGSDFFVYISLPVAEGEAVQVQQTETVHNDNDDEYQDVFKNKNILMAEDNEINAMISVEILNEMGANVEVVGDGHAAVEKFETSEPGYYDFILMDVQMPVMDGRSAARAIRSLDKQDAVTVPIFALSADAFVEDERLSKESGMDGHFAKPLDFNTLRVEIGKFLKTRHVQATRR